MKVHCDWPTNGFDLLPVAAGVGVFARRDFLRTWWDHWSGEAECRLVESGSALVPFLTGPDGVAFVGDEDLVDYHSPLGSGAEELIAEFFAGQPAGTRFRLDSLPAEAAGVVQRGIAAAGTEVSVRQHAASLYLELPDDYPAFLELIGKKERHELRRKARRFEEAHGLPRLVETEDIGEFVRLHRLSPGEKGAFMTAEMEEFFRGLAALPSAKIDLLIDEGGNALAAAFGFTDVDRYFLYNSAYDPAAAKASPGMVLLAGLIEKTVRSGLRVFDFLKGDEAYKYRLGAKDRLLYVVEGSR